MACTFKMLSLSLPPGVVEELAAIGKSTGRVAARVAREIVLRDVAKTLVLHGVCGADPRGLDRQLIEQMQVAAEARRRELCIKQR